MSADPLDPRSALIVLSASVITLVAGKASMLPADAILADDGLTPAGQQLVAQGRSALGHVAALAQTFGCAMQPPDTRTIPATPGLPAHVREILLRVIKE